MQSRMGGIIQANIPDIETGYHKNKMALNHKVLVSS